MSLSMLLHSHDPSSFFLSSSSFGCHFHLTIRECIWQCCFCFDLLFFPNFPPSLPRALSYSQDIKVIHAKDLIKALLSQNATTSHSALLTFTSFDSDLFHFILFFLSFSSSHLMSFYTLRVSVFCLSYTSVVISALSMFYWSRLFFWLHHY